MSEDPLEERNIEFDQEWGQGATDQAEDQVED